MLALAFVEVGVLLRMSFAVALQDGPRTAAPRPLLLLQLLLLLLLLLTARVIALQDIPQASE